MKTQEMLAIFIALVHFVHFVLAGPFPPGKQPAPAPLDPDLEHIPKQGPHAEDDPHEGTPSVVANSWHWFTHLYVEYEVLNWLVVWLPSILFSH